MSGTYDGYPFYVEHGAFNYDQVCWETYIAVRSKDGARYAATGHSDGDDFNLYDDLEKLRDVIVEDGKDEGAL